MKIFCVGRNYAAHAAELKNDVPEEPVIFIKPKTAHFKGTETFHYPEFTNELHYEAEVVLRVSRNGKYVQPKSAHLFFDAITVGIDFTARDVQNLLKQKSLPWEKAKAWDNSAVTGKWMDAEPLKKGNCYFSLKKNGAIVQEGNTADMIFNYEEIIANISQYFSLNIGDLIFTGTPAGVGECVAGDFLEGYLGDEKVFSLLIA